MNPVLSKQDFVERFIVGEFGNRTPIWRQPKDVARGGGELYCLRALTPGAPARYKLTRQAMWMLWTPQHYISVMIPERVEKSLILQGEVWRADDGLYLYYSTLAVPMKEALAKASKSANWTTAKILLQEAMCPHSYEWLQHLLDSYYDHVVEFSSYTCNYGVVPGFNTIFWEVRKY